MYAVIENLVHQDGKQTSFLLKLSSKQGNGPDITQSMVKHHTSLMLTRSMLPPVIELDHCLYWTIIAQALNASIWSETN